MVVKYHYVIRAFCFPCGIQTFHHGLQHIQALFVVTAQEWYVVDHGYRDIRGLGDFFHETSRVMSDTHMIISWAWWLMGAAFAGGGVTIPSPSLCLHR